jgi:hypothetical protein
MKIDTFLATVGGLAILLFIASLRYLPALIIAVIVAHFVVKWW